MNRLLRITASTLVLLFAAGCATIDYDYPRTESYFRPTRRIPGSAWESEP